MKKTVVIGISSGIAAYKVLDLIKLLRKENREVFVVMTKQAAKMVQPINFEKASGNKVYEELFEKDFHYKNILKKRKVDHIELADRASVMVIVPATANIIAKLAYGLADDYVTTTVLAVTSPIIICPSMNVHMWNNPVVRENIDRLRIKGFQIIEPDTGMLACGYEGEGRLADIDYIKDEINKQLRKTDSLKGKKIIVTAGGTMEKIDEVRYITNRSSGKMGVAIAEECFLRGADVILFRSKNAVQSRFLLQEKLFTTSSQLFALIKKNIKPCDYFYHVAAVSDFSVKAPFRGKLSSKNPITLTLQPQIKIIDQIKKLNPKITLIAFKAEYGLSQKKLVSVAFKKLQETNADAVIANDISKTDRGFESDMNEVYIVLKNGTAKKIPYAGKNKIAEKSIDYLTGIFKH